MNDAIRDTHANDASSPRGRRLGKTGMAATDRDRAAVRSRRGSATPEASARGVYARQQRQHAATSRVVGREGVLTMCCGFGFTDASCGWPGETSGWPDRRAMLWHGENDVNRATAERLTHPRGPGPWTPACAGVTVVDVGAWRPLTRTGVRRGDGCGCRGVVAPHAGAHGEALGCRGEIP